MFRAFPDLVKPTKRNYSPPVQVTEEDQQIANVGCFGIIAIIVLFILSVGR
jgi:hypothetical protein